MPIIGLSKKMNGNFFLCSFSFSHSLGDNDECNEMNILSEMMFFVMGKVPLRIVIEIVLARFIAAIVCGLMIFKSTNLTTKNSFDFIKNIE